MSGTLAKDLLVAVSVAALLAACGSEPGAQTDAGDGGTAAVATTEPSPAPTEKERSRYYDGGDDDY